MTTVAFVCVHNAGRSQMAAAFARGMVPPGITVISAGTQPAKAVNPVVVEAMRERGFDLAGEVPRKLTFDEAMAANYFVTMGCDPEEACPAGYRGDVRDWKLADPKGKTLPEVRLIRDEVEERVRALIEELRRAGKGPP